jgi:regulator of replication initiation timing
MQKELFRLADWVNGMEENQIEYTKIMLHMKEQLETVTKERDELQQENAQLKSRIQVLEAEQDKVATDKWKQFVNDQMRNIPANKFAVPTFEDD